MATTRKQTRRQGNIYSLPNGKWRIRLTIGKDAVGNRIRLSEIVEGSATDAKRALRAMLKRQDDGLPVALSRQRLGAWANEWVEKYCKAGELTREDYRAMFDRYLKPHPELAARPLAALNPKGCTSRQFVIWVC